MNLQREKIVIIKQGHYEEPTGVLDLPKRDTYLMVPPVHDAHMDDRAVPAARQSSEFPRWITHTAILELFLRESKHDWLLVLEDHINFETTHIQKLQSVAQKGVYLLDAEAGAYLIDKPTAKIVLEQNRVFYASIGKVFDDLHELHLIEFSKPFTVEHIDRARWFLYLPFFLCIVAAFLVFVWVYYTQAPISYLNPIPLMVSNADGSPLLRKRYGASV